MLDMDSQIKLDRQTVLNRIGYSNSDEPSHRISSLVDDYIENYHDLIASAYICNIRDIKSIDGNRVDIGGSVVLESGKVSRLLKRCEMVAFFALTIGSYLEELVAYLADKGLVLQATVLDAIGSGTAENMAAKVEQSVKTEVGRRGLITSLRFSPGYCDWDVNQQEMVFRALGNSTAGITLNESMLMIPQKSVSGIIGIGRPGNGIEEYNPCRTCMEKDCPGRRK